MNDAAVLLSGGVDSSVALFLLRQAGVGRLTAYYLKIWLEDDAASLGNCPWEEDLSYARQVCEKAGVKLEVLPLQREYYDRVVTYAVEELRQGFTPSPDLFCNQRIKFGAFYDRAGRAHEVIATGHYARTQLAPDGRHQLLRAIDPIKDQSYFLSHLSQEQVSRLHFPLGNLPKARVRELAAAWDLPNKDRPDSQGICFLGNIRYPDFVRHYLGEKPGPIREQKSGKQLGTHKGVWFYTVGQRSGLGLSGGPWYVAGKDMDSSTVWVNRQDEAPGWEGVVLGECSWISGQKPDFGSLKGLVCKLRHGPALVPCTVDDGAELVVNLSRPDRGVAAGQFCVLYDGEVCLGTGRITGPKKSLKNA